LAAILTATTVAAAMANSSYKTFQTRLFSAPEIFVPDA